jgi:hypothetical protein
MASNLLVRGTCRRNEWSRRNPCSHYYTCVNVPTGHPSPEGFDPVAAGVIFED